MNSEIRKVYIGWSNRSGILCLVDVSCQRTTPKSPTSAVCDIAC